MSHDPVRSFRRHFQRDSLQLRAQSGVARLVPDPCDDPPRRYFGLLRGGERFVRGAGGVFAVERSPISLRLEIPDDYCSCFDGSLQLRVVRLLSPIAHPNVGPGGILCLGPRFRPGTRLRPLLEHVHRIVTGRTYAAESPLDPESADWFRRHPERVRALRSAPLWRARVAEEVVVRSVEPPR